MVTGHDFHEMQAAGYALRARILAVGIVCFIGLWAAVCWYAGVF